MSTPDPRLSELQEIHGRLAALLTPEKRDVCDPVTALGELILTLPTVEPQP